MDSDDFHSIQLISMDPIWFAFVFKDSDRFLYKKKIHSIPLDSKWFLLIVFMDSYGFQWISMIFYGKTSTGKERGKQRSKYGKLRRPTGERALYKYATQLAVHLMGAVEETVEHNA
jgi:hypothetical protein